MSSRTTFLHLSPQPIASSSRLPWAPIRRSFSYIHSSSPLPPLRLLRPPSSVTSLRERNVHSIRHASTVASTSTPPDIPPFPPRPKIQVTPPSLSAIKEEGYLDDDVVLIPEDQAALFITPEAIRVCLSFCLIDHNKLKPCSNSSRSRQENRPIPWPRGSWSYDVE